MSIRSVLYFAIANRWASFIENPEGFPYQPNEHNCWLWKGYMAPGDRPRAKLLGQQVNPRRILYELHTGNNPHLRMTCGNLNCINPLHAKGHSEVEERVPVFTASNIDWSLTFKGMHHIDFDNITAEELAAATGAPLEAVQRYLEER
jgi:hypothetical protein